MRCWKPRNFETPKSSTLIAGCGRSAMKMFAGLRMRYLPPRIWFGTSPWEDIVPGAVLLAGARACRHAVERIAGTGGAVGRAAVGVADLPAERAAGRAGTGRALQAIIPIRTAGTV